MKTRLRRALVLAFVAGGATLPPAGAQQPTAAFGRYRLDVWRAQDGVRLAFTSNLVETRDGYLWLSSESGVTRFDGVRFRIFDGTNTPALAGRPRLQTVPLLEDHVGALWIGSDVGLFTYAGGVMQPAALDSSLTIDQVNAAIVGPDGTLWGVTRSGRVLRRPRGESLREVKGAIVSYSGSSLAVDSAGAVWIAAGDDAVYRVHDDTLQRVVFPPGLLVDDPNRAYVTSDGSVWFGTRTALIRLRSGRFERIPLPARDAQSALSSLQEGPDGSLWIGTHGAGLYIYDGERFTPFTRRDGLSDDRVIEILRDRSGNMWVATRDGLNRFRPVPFDVHTAATGLPTEMPGGMIGEPSGTIWLAPPTGGLFRGSITGAHASFVEAEAVRNYDRVTVLAHARGGGVWAGRLLGTVSRFVAGEAPSHAAAEGLPPITEILEDADGTLWIGTWRGLFRRRGGELAHLTEAHGLPDAFVHRMLRTADGTLWIATQTGVARATEEDGLRFEPVPMPAGSVNRAIVLFEAPRGTLWLGSAEGLARVAGGAPAFISVAQGLPETWVGSGDEDGQGRLWIGQLGGVTRVELEDLIAVANGRESALSTVTTFEALDGLPGGDPGAWPHPWTFRDPRGHLWFAMGHGIAVADPARAAPQRRPPAIHLEEIEVDGTPQTAAGVITLGPEVRRLQLRYTGVDLTHGPGVRFRHRLEGFDTAWTDAGAERTASYTSLAAGRYTFRVTGRTGSGEWSPTEATLDIRVLAPFYRRAWFVGAVLLALTLILWSVHRAVLHARTSAIHEERTRLAREIHDSLMQGFGGIALELHAASARLELDATKQPLLDRVLSLIDRTLTQARHLVWDIRQTDLASSSLTDACDEAARRFFAETGTKVRIEERGRRHRLPPRVGFECQRIVQEALANVRLHAHAEDVVLRLEGHWNRLLVSIRDDGIGFDSGADAVPAGHWGILGMRERAARIGADLRVLSRPGAGTEVVLTVPSLRWLPVRGDLRED